MKIVRLGDVCELVKGRKPVKFVNDGSPYLTARMIRGLEEPKYIDENDNICVKINPDDLIIIMDGSNSGEVFTGLSGILASTMGLAKHDRSLSSQYLMYFLMTHRENFANSKTGSAIPHLNKERFESLKITVPAIDEQRRIVGRLDTAFKKLNQAIELTRKNIENSQELFDSSLNAIFETPHADWTNETLGNVCEFQGGSQPPKSTFSYVKRVGDIRLLQIRDYKSDRHIVYIPRSTARRFCEPEDVMIGRYGPPVFQILRGLEGAYNVALMKAVPDEKKLTKDFLYWFLKHRRIQNYIINLSDRAAGQSGINKQTIEPYPIQYPKLDIQHKVATNIEMLSKNSMLLKYLYKRKLEKLYSLKQSILEEAFSDKVIT